MCASIGHTVRRLTRIKMGPIALGNLRPGQWRDLTPKEVEKLKTAAGHEHTKDDERAKGLENAKPK
jgi:16S rRNA U516 pseudouridylate synthase RsuA-like enzyme